MQCKTGEAKKKGMGGGGGGGGGGGREGSYAFVSLINIA
jgi:hypothetical protein